MGSVGEKYKFSEADKKLILATPEKKPEVHSVQQDTIEPTVSYATDEGLVFDSRSKYEEHLKQHGFEITGGDHFTGKGVLDPIKKIHEPLAERLRKAEWGMLDIDPEIRAEVLEMQRKVKWGMAPLNEKEKELCYREEMAYRDYQKRMRT